VTYPYHDETGTLLFEVLRYRAPDGGKTFKQRRPDGRGGSVWNLDRVRRVLYRLPGLQGQETVFVTEGEKDADRLVTLGLIATTNPQGAGQWREEYTAQLVAAGVKLVVVLPDNDDPGDKHAVAVARSCLTAGLAVKVVRLPELAPKGDVSDWLAVGHTCEELAHVVKAVSLAALVDLESAAGRPDAGPVLVRLADVAPERVSWLWPGRVARGKLTLLAGDPGLGKSFLTLDMAARVSTAGQWPDGGRAPSGNVILLSAEDGPADTIRPRLDALGADVSRIHLLCAVRRDDTERAFCLAADLPALERAIRETDSGAVVIDPLTAYLGKTDSYKDAEVRGLLAPLAALAERYKVAVVVVMHLAKDSQRRAIHRAGGSVGFVGAARVVLAVGKDDDDQDRRLLVPVKTNLSAPPGALAYRIVPVSPDVARVEWEAAPVANVDADALLGPRDLADREERRDADELLRELLADGERESAEMLRASEGNGISRRTMFRAKARLGVTAHHRGQPGKRGGAWYWRLPDLEGPDAVLPKSATDEPKRAIHGDVALFAEPSEEKGEPAHTSAKSATPGDMASGGTLRESGAQTGALQRAEEVDPW
jgi:hypothetical protein